jgi:hypothetical protein
MAQQLLDFDSSFIGGSNSSVDPSQLARGQFWSGINVINMGGVISCRPGHRCLFKMPKGNLQGAAIFRPMIGLEQTIFAVEGKVYQTQWPFRTFTQIEGLSFLPSAKQVFFCQTIQSAQRITPGNVTSAIELITPKAVMIIQDGGFTAPGYYDGTNAGHIKGLPFQTPIGGPMQWVGDRLWVAIGSQVQASDIANPFSFVEQIYLGGTAAFQFSREVTAMSKTPSIEFPQLLVFTDEDTSLIQADIRDRSLWQTTIGFQKEILQVGCSSNRAVTSEAGRLSWWSSAGLVVFDPATSRGWTSRTPIRDNEMLVSKKFLKDDLSLVAMGAFGQWLLISVPAEDTYNKHTWVFNNASFETVSDEGGPTWSGYWIGTRPVEWVYGVIAGAERIFHVSTDSDGENRFWQSFTPDRLDNNCPITWAVFTRGYMGLSSPAQKPPGVDCRYTFADIAFTAIEDDTDIGIFMAPGVRGAFKPIATRRVAVEKGSLSFDRDIDMATDLFAYKGQSRIVRTEDLSNQFPDVESGSCPVESNLNDDNEESHQMLIVGHGPGTLRWVRSFAIEAPEEDFSGDAKACENEPEFNATRFDGESVFDTNSNVANELLSAKVLRMFFSTETASLTQSGISAVGVGSAESIVSQSAADRVAQRVAQRAAEIEIEAASPPFVSKGIGF